MKLSSDINLIFILTFLLAAGCSYAPFKNEFAQLSGQRIIVSGSDKIFIDQSGGHLQGIQTRVKNFKIK